MLKGKLSTGKDPKKLSNLGLVRLRRRFRSGKQLKKNYRYSWIPFFHITSAFFADIRTCTFHSTVRVHYSEI
jgi:hypothetical protein